jgi:hypothetical protein
MSTQEMFIGEIKRQPALVLREVWHYLKVLTRHGEVFPTRQVNYLRRHLPGALFVNLYGPIEISVGRETADDEELSIAC